MTPSTFSFSLFVDASGAIGFGLQYDGDCLTDPEQDIFFCGGGRTAGQLVLPGRWTHVAATFDFSTVQIFVDGHLVRKISALGGRFSTLDVPRSPASAATGVFAVGNGVTATDSSATCRLVDIRAYSRVLLPEEVDLLASATRPGFRTVLDTSVKTTVWREVERANGESVGLEVGIKMTGVRPGKTSPAWETTRTSAWKSWFRRTRLAIHPVWHLMTLE
jgi:Concanavalin A-like lectin/glucanases superfamily